MSIITLFKATRKFFFSIRLVFYTPYAKLFLYLNGVKYSKKMTVFGFLYLHVTRRGKVILGENLHINSGNYFNIIGRQQKTTFWVEGILTIGDNVGISSTAIICNHMIEIGNNVMIGGNTVIYDTDFHSLNPLDRKVEKRDKENVKSANVKICDNVFIGAHSTILKGITIGTNSIIGACSVVTKDVPENEIWAGNPAQFIKKLPNFHTN